MYWGQRKISCVPATSTFPVLRTLLEREPAYRLRIALGIILYVNAALLVVATFSPSLPRIKVPEWLASGTLPATLILVVLAYLFLHRCALSSLSLRKGTRYFGVVLSLLLLTRLPYLTNCQAWMNSDRSVTLLMTKHIAEGSSHPIYFYGQLYQGSLDAYFYSLVYRILPSLQLSVAITNIVIFSLFVLIGAALIQRITGSGSLFYPVLFLSMPLTSASFLSMDYIRGIPLIVFLQTAVIYLVFNMVFEGRQRAFLLGAVSGTLFWIYQPAVTTLAVTLAWAAAGLVWQRGLGAGKALLLFLPGFLLGALPHVLSEINNEFFNTKTLFLSSRPAGIAEVFSATNLRNAFVAVVAGVDANPAVSMVLVALFLIGCVASLLQSSRQRSLRWIYLPSIFFLTLLLTILSGFSADTRWVAHYRLLSFFTLLIVALVLSPLDRFDGRLSRSVFATGWLLFAIWRTAEQGAALRGPHLANHQDIDWWANRRNAVVVGNYFNTIRFAPFVDESTVITTAPSAEDPDQIFALSKYYPLAFHLGGRWNDAPRHLIAHRRESRSVERWLAGLSIVSYTDKLPSGRYTIYSGFSPEPSPYFLSILSSYFRERYLPEIDAFDAILERKTKRENQPKVEGHRIVTPQLSSAISTEDQVAQFFQSNWRYVMKNDSGQISFPLGVDGEGAAFRVPAGVAPECGSYDEYLYFLDMPVSYRGSVEIEAETCDGSFVLSDLRDRLTFSQGDELVSGLPVDGLQLKIKDREIESIDLHLYSFFDFDSSIWGNRYEQKLIVNHREFSLKQGRNLIRYRQANAAPIRLESRYKTLLPSHDTSGNVAFHNTGVVVERIVARRGDIAEDIGLFLIVED